MRQFFLDLPRGADLPAVGDEITLAAEESHHLLNVLRSREDRELELVDGRGHRLRGRAAGRDGRLARVEILAVAADPQEAAPPRLRLACGVVKGKRWEWALEKAVECGVHAVAPLLTAHGVVEAGAGRRERWRGVLRSALKQSGRCLLPELAEPRELASFLGDDPGGPLAFGAVPAERPVDVVAGLPTPGTGIEAPAWLTVVVGPEGGWSPDEVRALLAAGGRPLDLGPHVLRTETAAVAALTLAQDCRRRWRTRSADPV